MIASHHVSKLHHSARHSRLSRASALQFLNIHICLSKAAARLRKINGFVPTIGWKRHFSKGYYIFEHHELGRFSRLYTALNVEGMNELLAIMMATARQWRDTLIRELP
ncbi:uncharacterized protein LACBIDRAFT_310999 [Laccaria bicolor S238N-H82]|uniref:Predicted protein n=1 Tax=Laccaria bicolor (strain S238N-H82 / ATCC MYA-4686) TaxID=486041 RepID=B0DVI2_LACBS|nr:uncharacterized protein LACBIDRAFT_310999 [Laccaria bicolor S238N-H82]EDR01421.1 predicted protein [Laccaria bicolor S238N-H82]|eukprot:XP_001887966.1 predicted protein [Laccaria bicolor S238N-H82]